MDEQACLVTGGTGFLGRRLVHRLLAEGRHVRVLSRRPAEVLRNLTSQGIEVICGDLSVPGDLRPFLDGVSIVFHMAGETRDRAHFESVNVVGTRRVVEAAAGVGVRRFIHVSSVGVFGPSDVPIVTEATPCDPRSAYERSKLAGERLAAEVAAQGHLPLTVVRPANVFGDGDPQRRLASLIRSVRTGRFFFVGPGEAMLNYAYVEDVAEACRLLARRGEAVGQTYIVSDPCPLREFVTCIADSLGVPAPVRRVAPGLAAAATAASELVSLFLRRPVALTRGKARIMRSQQVYSPKKLRDEVPDWPIVGWREGLRRIVAWYRSSGAL